MPVKHPSTTTSNMFRLEQRSPSKTLYYDTHLCIIIFSCQKETRHCLTFTITSGKIVITTRGGVSQP